MTRINEVSTFQNTAPNTFVAFGQSQLIALQDKSTQKRAQQNKTEKEVKLSQAGQTGTIDSKNKVEADYRNAMTSPFLYNLVISLKRYQEALKSKNPSLIQKTKTEAEAQITTYASSWTWGEKDISNIRISFQSANNVTIANESALIGASSSGLEVPVIKYRSKGRLGDVLDTELILGGIGPSFSTSAPLIDTKNFLGLEQPKEAWSAQFIQKLSTGSLFFQKTMKSVTVPGTGWQVAVSCHGPNIKNVNDKAKGKNQKPTQDPSISGFSFLVSLKATVGWVMVGPFWEFGRLFAAPRKNGAKANFHLVDRLNLSLSPDGLKVARRNIPKVFHTPIKIVAHSGSAGLQASGTVKLLSVGLEKLAPKYTEKMILEYAARGILIRQTALGPAMLLRALSGPVGWAIAGGFFLYDLHQLNEEKKAAYRAKILELVKIGAYMPGAGIPAVLGGMYDTGIFNVGNISRMISDVVDEACRQKLANPKALKQEWIRELNYVGRNKTESLLGRMVAATVLGDAKAARTNFGQLPFTENSFLSKESVVRKQVMTSLFNIKTKRSEVLASMTEISAAPSARPLSLMGYRSLSAKFSGGNISAIPGEVDAKGNTKWQMSLTTGDGLSATTYAELKRQFVLKDFGPGSYAKRDLESKIKAQRDKFPKPTMKYEPYVAKIYGSSFIATFVRSGENGKNYWKITGTSDIGIPATVISTIKGQFSADNLKPGTYFKRELDRILSSQ